MFGSAGAGRLSAEGPPFTRLATSQRPAPSEADRIGNRATTAHEPADDSCSVISISNVRIRTSPTAYLTARKGRQDLP